VIQSWDMTFKDLKSSDYVVGQVWLRRGPLKWLAEQVRFQGDFVRTLQELLLLMEKWSETQAILIEAAANGPAIISALQKKVSGIIPIIPQGSKLARLYAVSPIIESGTVLLPNPDEHSWVKEYMTNFRLFPNATYDDEVDATTQALSYMPNFNADDLKELLESIDIVINPQSITTAMGIESTQLGLEDDDIMLGTYERM